MKRMTNRCARVIRTCAAALAVLGLARADAQVREDAAMLDVRMVEARTEPGPNDPRLNDIRGELQRNLPYGAFEMKERAAVSAVDGVAHMGAYTLRASGGAHACQVTIEHKGRVLVQTRLRLQPGKPAVLGGFANERGHRILFVILAR